MTGVRLSLCWEESTKVWGIDEAAKILARECLSVQFRAIAPRVSEFYGQLWIVRLSCRFMGIPLIMAGSSSPIPLLFCWLDAYA